ncbi:hypothetical protein ASPWEDRAFT_25630 [Aspergillus wentii DTO 134E9]|uniref:Paramyosin n=1 Tax=Aspergillus wentii DTO 134E9 TaxID=1073089 RepID=A0A1L9RY53_ASPWE|nr:uncharacterized protein ASPWEDRAFT_25630 [Aspergillus wentii DTO 134E9]KAI9931495.1 hypothetical protein MW887_010070 [Aspergillus wentii]OJJ39835.1 hypothetical protein ASPWEDRAFT_25630 [Aspergillus wentii DTO 134E9]
MSDKMELDTPTTRDPRLASRPPMLPPSRQNSLDNLNSLPSASNTPPSILQPADPQPRQSDSSPADQFIQAISGLVQAAVTTSKNNSERERLQKRKETTDGLLKRANAQSSNFPTTAAFFQSHKNNEDVDLGRIDNAIRQHISNYRQLENSLKAKWGLLQGQSQSEDTNKLEPEIQNLKKEVESAKAESSKLSGNNQSLTREVTTLQGRATFLEKTITRHVTNLNTLSRDVKNNQTRFESLVSNLSKDKASLQDPQVVAQQVRADIDDLNGKHTKLSEEVDPLLKSQTKSPSVANVETLEKKVDNFGHRLDSLEKTKPAASDVARRDADSELKSELNDMDSRVKNLETDRHSHIKLEDVDLRFKKLEANIAKSLHNPSQSQSQSQAIQGLQSRVRVLAEHLEDLERVKGASDDILIGEMEKLEKRAGEKDDQFKSLTEELTVLKQDYGHIADKIKDLDQKEDVMALSGSLLGTQRVLESVKIGLHSLETRYNNLSTEPIVKNMVVAMQEMYPSAGQLTEQVAALKAQLEALDQRQSGQLMDVNKDIKSQSEESNRLRNDLTTLHHSLGEVWKQANNSGLGQQHYQQLHGNILSLYQKFEDHTAKMKEQLESKDTSDEDLRQNLNQERDSLRNQVQSIADKLKAFANELDETKSAHTSSKDATKADIMALINRTNGLEKVISNNGQLVDRISRLENSTSNDELVERITRLEDPTSNHQLVDRIGRLEAFTSHDQLIVRINRLEEDYQALLEQFENTKKAIESSTQEASFALAEQTEIAESPVPKYEGTPIGSDTPNVEQPIEEPCTVDPSIAESNNADFNNVEPASTPGPAVKKKNKKKRPRLSGVTSEDERTNSPTPAAIGIDGSLPERKKPKKKKKRKTNNQSEPITID